MFHKALWMRNYKLAKPAVWGFHLLIIFFMPLSFIQHAQTINKLLHDSSGNFSYYHSFNASGIAIFGMFALIIMAGLLIGLERSSHATDFTFSLPISRRSIFLSKWLFGAAHIVGSLTVNTALSILIYKTTIIKNYESPQYLFTFYGFAVLFLIAIFSFSLFVGTFTASLVPQLVLSFIFLFFPVGMMGLLLTFLRAHFPFADFSFWNGKLNNFVNVFTLPLPLTNFQYNFESQNSLYYRHDSLLTWWIAIGYTLVTTGAGILLFQRTKNENNGRILVFDQLRGFFTIGTVACFALLGGTVFSEANNVPSLAWYYTGVILFGGLSYFILSKLLNLRLQWRR